MNRFLNIDWNPPLEDIVDNIFINEKRLEKESVVHRIIAGNFKDPFKNIEEDYKDVKIDLMKDIVTDLSEEDSADIETNETKKKCKSQNSKKLKCYVPGIVQQIFKFPKKSVLNHEQQAMCLRVLLKFSESNKPKLTQKEREELQQYMDLQQIISQEQDEFLEFAKSKWHERSFKILCEDYINLCWKSKIQYVHELPKYYTEITSIPFLANKNIEVKFVSTCLETGNIPKIVLPTFTKPYILRTNSKQLEKRFFSKKNNSNEELISSKLPVSEDINCKKYAENNNVDLVISSSGLNCLVNNIGSNHSNSWILPIIIKRHNDKNVIYIDKPGPPIAGTIQEKNTWVHKYMLKYFFIKAKCLVSENNEEYNDNIFGDVNCDEILKLEEKYENTLTQISNEAPSTVSEKIENIEEISQYQNVNSDTNSSENMFSVCKQHLHAASNFSNTSSSQDIKNENSKVTADSVSYKLFTIGPQLSDQNELMKDVIKEYRILVRTKTDGFQILENNVQRLLLLTPKLEHQVDLGAEAVTLEEAVKQWISLIFRPHTFLARVRISAKTSEVLQIEHRTAMSISNEVKRLYNIKVEDSLIILHNVIQSLTNLSSGRYVIRHTVRNGAFAAVYKVVESSGKNVFDMHTVYDKQFHTLFKSPWIPLDKTIPTPMLKCFGKFPALFQPSKKGTFIHNKKDLKANKFNTGITRKSLRNKKKKANI